MHVYWAGCDGKITVNPECGLKQEEYLRIGECMYIYMYADLIVCTVFASILVIIL
jgi:hypothetical protein